MESNLGSKCRACLSENEEMVFLFDVYEHDLTLATILQSCISTEVNENDGLPQYLCHNCVIILIQFYNFSVTYEHTEKELHSIISNQYNKSLEADSNEHVETIINLTKNEFDLKDSLQDLQEITIISIDEDNFDNLQKIEVVNGENLKQEQIVSGNVESEIVLHGDLESNVKSDKYQPVNVQNGVFGEYETITKYECSVCGESHLYASSFQQHMRVKHNMPDIECMDYGKTVRLKVENYGIVASNENENLENEEHKCRLCSKTFLSSMQLQNHSKLHNVPKKFVCEVCGSRFIRKNYLDDHMEGHSTEKKHVCRFCGKAFRRRTVLRAHKRVHTHPNHYVCELCGRGFTNSSTLKTHRLLIHVKERNFKCLICNLTFPLKSTLTKHLIRHQKRENGEKGFDCTLCEMKYKDKSSLKRHFEVKHQGRVQLVFCSDCPKRYTSKANLLKHRRKHHSNAE